VRRKAGRMWIVRDQHDGLFQITVERREYLQDLFTRLGVEISGRFVRENQIRICNNCTRDCDALFLAARQLPWLMIHSICKTDQLERRFYVLASLSFVQFCQKQRQPIMTGTLRRGRAIASHRTAKPNRCCSFGCGFACSATLRFHWSFPVLNKPVKLGSPISADRPALE